MTDLWTLPYGVVRVDSADPVVAVRVGDDVLDLAALAEAGLLDPLDGAWRAGSLDPFLGAGRAAWTAVRARLLALVHGEETGWRAHLHPLTSTVTALAFTVADYVDFYASEDHATHVGRIFRPDSPGLPAAWKHLPIAYHGRAGTVVVSGTDVVRPSGVRGPDAAFGPTRRLDFECEVGFVVGTGAAGGRVQPDDFAEHVFGVVLVNDWSARDVQAFEYVPLGPMLGKSFATSVSAWVTPLEALDAAWVDPPAQHPTPYLTVGRGGLDLALEVLLDDEVVSRPPFAGMYWTPPQMLAHLTANGASLRPGDLFASGTVSGPAPGQRGSMLELAWGGTEPLVLADGRSRSWLDDGDTVTLRASAPGPDGRTVHLGEVTGRVLPARA